MSRGSGENFFIGSNIKNLRAYFDISLSKMTSSIDINFRTARNYEARSILPSLDVLIKISRYFQISLDFLVLWNETDYPRNLKLFSLAENCEAHGQAADKNHIAATVQSFLLHDRKLTDIKKDVCEIQLKNNFHSNLALLRESKKISQKELAGMLSVTQAQIVHYEKESIPSLDKMIKLSEIFNISLHAIATGEKLSFDFQDKDFESTILKADHFLSLDDHKMLIRLMEAILKK